MQTSRWIMKGFLSFMQSFKGPSFVIHLNKGHPRCLIYLSFWECSLYSPPPTIHSPTIHSHARLSPPVTYGCPSEKTSLSTMRARKASLCHYDLLWYDSWNPYFMSSFANWFSKGQSPNVMPILSMSFDHTLNSSVGFSLAKLTITDVRTSRDMHL